MKKIALVEDERHLSDLIKLNLELEGYSVQCFYHGNEVVELLSDIDKFSLFILDVMLPEISGYTLCKEIRNISKVPILFLSAKGNTQDRIYGLKLGANDYLPKPFDLEELLLKVQILAGNFQDTNTLNEGNVYEFDDFIINFEEFSVKQKSSNIFHELSKRELSLLKLFTSNEGKVISREEIMNHLWDDETTPNSRTIDNFILNFRKWMEKNPKNPKYFHSVRGVGYRFTSK